MGDLVCHWTYLPDPDGNKWAVNAAARPLSGGRAAAACYNQDNDSVVTSFDLHILTPTGVSGSLKDPYPSYTWTFGSSTYLTYQNNYGINMARAGNDQVILTAPLWGGDDASDKVLLRQYDCSGQTPVRVDELILDDPGGNTYDHVLPVDGDGRIILFNSFGANVVSASGAGMALHSPLPFPAGVNLGTYNNLGEDLMAGFANGVGLLNLPDVSGNRFWTFTLPDNDTIVYSSGSNPVDGPDWWEWGSSGQFVPSLTPGRFFGPVYWGSGDDGNQVHLAEYDVSSGEVTLVSVTGRILPNQYTTETGWHGSDTRWWTAVETPNDSAILVTAVTGYYERGLFPLDPYDNQFMVLRNAFAATPEVWRIFPTPWIPSPVRAIDNDITKDYMACVSDSTIYLVVNVDYDPTVTPMDWGPTLWYTTLHFPGLAGDFEDSRRRFWRPRMGG